MVGKTAKLFRKLGQKFGLTRELKDYGVGTEYQLEGSIVSKELLAPEFMQVPASPFGMTSRLYLTGVDFAAPEQYVLNVQSDDGEIRAAIRGKDLYLKFEQGERVILSCMSVQTGVYDYAQGDFCDKRFLEFGPVRTEVRSVLKNPVAAAGYEKSA